MLARPSDARRRLLVALALERGRSSESGDDAGPLLRRVLASEGQVGARRSTAPAEPSVGPAPEGR